MMKTNAILFCLCIGMFAQCDRAGDRGIMSEPGSGETVASVTPPPEEEEIPAEEPPPAQEEPVYKDVFESTDIYHYRISEKATCASPAKTGKVNDIVGKWKLMLEISGKDTTDRSCEEIVYHFREDGTLTVSNSADVCDYEYGGYPFCPVCDPGCNPEPSRIGDDAVFCEVLLRVMIVYPRIGYTEIGCVYPDHEFKTFFLRIE
ncbi:MAG: hypothetical protein LBP50_06815 [Tannerella sp.]|jgi:hypothetical protein|nr:hypothetical protein [Tannerella sp.]